MTNIHIGSIWMKKHGEWGGEDGQLIIVERVDKDIRYRYVMHSFVGRGAGIWPEDIFLSRMELIQDI